jgi:hypothetical protein
MMFIDMTNELAPIIFGLNAGLIISGMALISQTPVNTWFRSLGGSVRQPVAVHRPVLAR